jgi:hypothetical protein
MVVSSPSLLFIILSVVYMSGELSPSALC